MIQTSKATSQLKNTNCYYSMNKIWNFVKDILSNLSAKISIYNKLESSIKIKMYLLAAGLACFTFFLGFYSITSRDNLQVSDEIAVFSSGISLATRGTLEIDNLQWLQAGVNIGQIGRENHLYAKYFPGNIFSVAIIYKLSKIPNDQPFLLENHVIAPSLSGALSAMKVNAIFGALGITSLFFLLKRYFDWRTTIITVFLIGICSDWWYQSRGLLSEVGAGAFLTLSLCFAVYKKPYLSSFSFALSLFFRPQNIIALPIVFFAIYPIKRKTIFAGLIVIFGIFVLAFYNWFRFYSPINFGYGSENFSSSLLLGLFGVLLSPGRSLFLYSPIIVLAIPGIRLFFREEKLFTGVCVLTIIAYVIMIAKWDSWDGGVTWGSRLLTPIIPLLGFFIAPIIRNALKNKLDIIIILVLAVLGFSVQILTLARDPWRVMGETVYNNQSPITYGQTLFTISNSWMALQIRSLHNWHFCDLDAYTLRHLLFNCR